MDEQISESRVGENKVPEKWLRNQINIAEIINKMKEEEKQKQKEQRAAKKAAQEEAKTKEPPQQQQPESSLA